MPRPSKKSADKPAPAIGQAEALALGEPDAVAAPARPQRSRKRIDKDESRPFAVEAARLLHDSHCTDILVYDVRGKSDVMDYLLIATGTSDRQMRSVADDVEELGKTHNLSAYGREADGPTTWIVLDFIDVVVHLFEPQTRAFYDLEMLWGDAPQVKWRR
jgi:ribosome-associated protein